MEPRDALMANMGVLIAIVAIASLFGIFLIICQWMIYAKAGQPGWACLIPIYNLIVLLKIVGRPVWWFFLMCISIVNIVIIIMVLNGLSKSFGKDSGFTVGLLFLSFIFYPILAFGSAKYIGPGGVPSAEAAQ